MGLPLCFAHNVSPMFLMLMLPTSNGNILISCYVYLGPYQNVPTSHVPNLLLFNSLLFFAPPPPGDDEPIIHLTLHYVNRENVEKPSVGISNHSGVPTCLLSAIR